MGASAHSIGATVQPAAKIVCNMGVYSGSQTSRAPVPTHIGRKRNRLEHVSEWIKANVLGDGKPEWRADGLRLVEWNPAEERHGAGPLPPMRQVAHRVSDHDAEVGVTAAAAAYLLPITVRWSLLSAA